MKNHTPIEGSRRGDATTKSRPSLTPSEKHSQGSSLEGKVPAAEPRAIASQAPKMKTSRAKPRKGKPLLFTFCCHWVQSLRALAARWLGFHDRGCRCRRVVEAAADPSLPALKKCEDAAASEIQPSQKV